VKPTAKESPDYNDIVNSASTLGVSITNLSFLTTAVHSEPIPKICDFSETTKPICDINSDNITPVKLRILKDDVSNIEEDNSTELETDCIEEDIDKFDNEEEAPDDDFVEILESVGAFKEIKDTNEDKALDASDFYQLVNHHYELRENGYQCLKCKFVAGNEAKIVTHIGIRHNGFSIREGKRLKCIICDRTFSKKDSMDQHIQEAHEGVDCSIKCNLCEFKCRTQAALKSHLFKNHGKSEYGMVCDKCDKTFACKKSLRIHINSMHTGIRLYCNLCDFSAATKGNLKKHMKRDHEGLRYKCNLCGSILSDVYHYKVHLETIHSKIGQESKILPSIFYMCYKCKKEFKNLDERQEHSKTCNGKPKEAKKLPPYCKLCKKMYSCQKSLRIHMESIHEDIKEKCPLCDYRGIKGNLKVHMRRKH